MSTQPRVNEVSGAIQHLVNQRGVPTRGRIDLVPVAFSADQPLPPHATAEARQAYTDFITRIRDQQLATQRAVGSRLGVGAEARVAADQGRRPWSSPRVTGPGHHGLT
jgi:hypothetical protein